MDMVKKNKWRVALENPDKVMQSRLDDTDSSMYVNRECSSLLMNIPLACYSVISGERVTTLSIDVRDLERVMFPRYRSSGATPMSSIYLAKYSEPCFLSQDLFDAMLMHGKLWYVDKMDDVIYLPRLPKPPQESSACLMEITLSDKDKEKQPKNLHTLISHMSDASLNSLLAKVFPHSDLNEKEKKIKELLKRIKASGSKDIFRLRLGELFSL